jgi:hypothetical protein
VRAEIIRGWMRGTLRVHSVACNQPIDTLWSSCLRIKFEIPNQEYSTPSGFIPFCSGGTEVAAKSLCSGRGYQPLLAYVATLSPSN